MNLKGKLIAFEGLDYAFKETNTKRLEKYIKDNYNQYVMIIGFPNYKSESSLFVREYLNKEYGNLESIDPYTVATFYAMDRYRTIKQLKIKELLNNGFTIILDRYVGSMLMYGSSRYDSIEDKNKYTDWVYDLEYNKNALPKEDIVLYMDVNIDRTKIDTTNRTDKEGIINDLHESNIEYLDKIKRDKNFVIDKYNWKRVKCNDDNNNLLSKDEIFNNILDILKDNL